MKHPCLNYLQSSNGTEKCFWFWIAGGVCVKGSGWKKCSHQKVSGARVSNPEPPSGKDRLYQLS